ncbi:Low affinity immunoglobulin epsilon Fc receptor [Triplophysa tibetana]|nr:Low affinity immunoglobulin epsilon Fc receptor [Triplophysa tibetana]
MTVGYYECYIFQKSYCNSLFVFGEDYKEQLEALNDQYKESLRKLRRLDDFIRSHSCEPCEDGWTAYDENCYFFSSEMQTWFDSRLSCGALDAHLVIIETEKEQGFLASKIKVYHWIGLNDLETEGRWVWVNNQTLEETGVQFWLKRESGQNEPDNWKQGDSSGENCAIMRDQLHIWCDVSCKSKYNFICEKKPTSSFMYDN